MGIKGILMGLFHLNSGKDGIWDFLGKRSADKFRVELEKERDEGTQRAIQLLRPGMVLREGGPDWFREISMPGTLPAGMLFTTAMPSFATFAPPSTTPPLAPCEPESPPPLGPGSAGDPGGDEQA
jgi:hypothetical protein